MTVVIDYLFRGVICMYDVGIVYFWGLYTWIKYIFGGLSIRMGIDIYLVGYIYGNICILRRLYVWE